MRILKRKTQDVIKANRMTTSEARHSRGFERVTPPCASWCVDWTKGNQDPAAWKQTSPGRLQPSFNYRQEFKSGSLLLITFWPIYRTAGITNYWTSALIILEMASLPSKDPTCLTLSLAQNVTYISFWLSVSIPLRSVGYLTLMWGSHIYVHN